MAIARGTSLDTTLGASPRQANIVISAGESLVVGTKGASGYATGVTAGGVGMTRIGDITSGAGEYNLSLWYLGNPGTGSIQISVSVASGNVGWTAETFSGTNNASLIGASATNTSSGSTSITSSLTTTYDNSWVVGYFSSSSNTLTASTGITFSQPQLNNVALGDSNGPKTPAGSYSMTTTSSTNGTRASIMAEIRISESSSGFLAFF